jgi:hypothetical protein
MHRIKVLGFVCLAVGAVGSSHAMPVCTAGNLADYISLGADGCSVGGVIFSNFRFSAISFAIEAPGVESIRIDPDTSWLRGTPVAGRSSAGLDFAFNQILLPVPRPATQDYLLPSLAMTVSYDVTSASGLERATMAPQLSADPLATASATLAVDSAICAAADASQGVPGPSGCALDGVGSAQMIQNIRLMTGPAFGAGAAIQSVAVRWEESGTDAEEETGSGAETPEPETWGLLVGGLALLAVGGVWARHS